jgi:hypothetical protein
MPWSNLVSHTGEMSDDQPSEDILSGSNLMRQQMKMTYIIIWEHIISKTKHIL